MKIIRAIALLASMAASPLNAQVITGPATIIDGKTLDMGGTAIMLASIDAPEIRQECDRDRVAWACGTEAAESLAAIIGSAPVICTIVGTNGNGTPLATCENETFDLGREMVRRGLALASDNAPEGYSAAAGIAQQLKSGLWAATYQPFAEWRAANPKAVTRIVLATSREARSRTATERPGPERRFTNALGCAIKGNRSIRGPWIYHLPGQRYYEETRPEDLFCTERQAQAAGYRRSKE
jgi:endonuclease YncB( thermonuclease family)